MRCLEEGGVRGVCGVRGVVGSLPLLFVLRWLLLLAGATAAVSPSLLEPEHIDEFEFILAWQNNEAISSRVGCFGLY
jgi:hypothetical protein